MGTTSGPFLGRGLWGEWYSGRRMIHCVLASGALACPTTIECTVGMTYLFGFHDYTPGAGSNPLSLE